MGSFLLQLPFVLASSGLSAQRHGCGSAVFSPVLRGRVWAPTRLRRVLARPQSTGKEKPTTDQKEVKATGRRGG